MNKPNYQKDMERIIENLQDQKQVPTLLLHSCCAPCSSYVLEYLSDYFKITVLYYNPNIYPPSEFDKRVLEQRHLIEQMEVTYPVAFTMLPFESGEFYSAVKNYEALPEGGERCFRCYRLRLEQTAKIAKEQNFDYFTTTLSISPLKNAVWLNEIGEELASLYDVSYLTSDFKKKNGYQRSVALSSEYGLYRQEYCGCIFSMKERENLAIKVVK